MKKMLCVIFFYFLTINSIVALSDEIRATEAVTYLCWDNRTPASIEDLESDPLLILRTSQRYTDHSDSLPRAWKRAAQFDLNTFSHDTSSLIIPPANNAAFLNIAPCIVNNSHIFDRSPAVFHLNNDSTCEKIWWQISSSRDFAEVISSFDSIQNRASSIALSDIEETFLESGQNYYFRVKTYSQNIWSQWSEPFAFTSNKPMAVDNIRIEKKAPGCYELCWEGCEDSSTSYYVFASNSMDFIPSIYTPFQPDTLLDSEIIDASATDNLLGETTEKKWPVDGHFAYYRVVAQQNKRLSIPSPIIRFWENGKAPVGNTLKIETTDFARRMTLPSAYSWMQMRDDDPESGHLYRYVKNPHVSEWEWNDLQQYFLPENHPAKSVLDRAFQKQRALESLSAIKEAGFKPIRKPQNDLVVARHPKLKGYLIKAYLDRVDIDERYWLMRRAAGARQVQKCIESHGYNDIMKVPQKWIYPLPSEPSPVKSKKGRRKDFILIVEDVKPLKYKKNKSAYKKRVTPEILDALWTVLLENLLVDSFYLPNISFCEDGKIAFLDTEFFNDNSRPMKMWKLAQYLSSDMHAYWDQLIQHNNL